MARVSALSFGFPAIAVLPFALLLVAIAVLPLAAPHLWESNRAKGVLCAVLASPTAVWLLGVAPVMLWHSLGEYASFICLLGSLFVVAGGIHLAGDLLATPRTNTAILAIGAVVANVIGTTGASMLLIRLLLRTNSERRNTQHIPFFFILIAANAGGLLTPLGDPPLFLGYLRGVPFFWTLRLWPVWLVAVAYLLALFYVTDKRAYAAESVVDLARDRDAAEPIRILGKRNFVFLGAVVGSVFLPSPVREVVMVCATIASLVLGRSEARQKNDFSFGPIIEVAILFAGIFITMVPALELLRQHGKDFGLVAPWHFFLTTGALSSVLDNAPTYLTFLSAAQGLGLRAEVVGVPAGHLVGISLGAVLMGANTYIGNGPNFMIKAIADAAGYRTPSFIGYAGRALLALCPLYAAIVIYLHWLSGG